MKRIEVTTGGASAVYGSDAIAGAVNFIMRDAKDIDGLEVRYDYGQTFENDARPTSSTCCSARPSPTTAATWWCTPAPTAVAGAVRRSQFSRINMDVRNGALVPAGTSNNPGTSFPHADPDQ